MVILSIETTGLLASCALITEKGITEKINETEYSHLQEIVPMTKKLMQEQKIRGEELDAVAVSRGPGSFTGVRIGVVTAKALAQVWNKPMVMVPTLMSFAFGAYDWLEKDKKYLFCPIFDARRNQVYSGVYEPFSKDPVIPDAPYDLDLLLEKLSQVSKGYDSIVFFGDGIRAYEEKLASFGCVHMLAPEKDRYQKASSVVILAKKLYEEGIITDCFGAEPEYLREAEAERKLKEKTIKK